ncbi:hypothetical protein AX15_000926 [Amanita polypyramis BW_CC]|nr:hypothetical protein AX15_000926 [Amanita polypyramis BW_CC]
MTDADFVPPTGPESLSQSTPEPDHAVENDTVSENPDAAATTRSNTTPGGSHEMPGIEAPPSPTKSKAELTVKPPQGKASSAPPTPLAKKIINSGTFGTGIGKATPRQSVSSSAATKPAAPLAPGVKKSSSASSTGASSKPTMATSRPPSSVTTANRRASVVPTRTGTVGSSTGTKASVPPATSKPASTATSSASTRQSVISPSGSITSHKSSATTHRSRASISEGIKRTTPTAIRPAPGTKVPSRSSIVGVAAKTSAQTGSIGSIDEVKEDGRYAEGVQDKLKDATEQLASKAQLVDDLESQITQLQASLAEARVEVKIKTSAMQELEQAKTSLEAKYKDNLETSDKQRDEPNSSIVDQLTAAEEKVVELQSAVKAKEGLIQSLNSQKSTLESELSVASENFKSAQLARDSVSQVEHEALAKAEADLKATITEIEALKQAHVVATEAAKSKSQDLEKSSSHIEQLEAQIARLKVEREENANKVSELEVEVLELKENQETVEDERDTALVKVKSLEDHISTLVASSQQAAEEARSKEAGFNAKVNELQARRAEELQSAADERAKVATALNVVQAQLEAARHELEQAGKDAESAAANHLQRLKEAEDSFVQQRTELEQKIDGIAVELEGQEAKYNSQLDAFKAEHELKLQDAFKRAKIEAGEEHALELQGLRASSNATIEQVRAASQTTVDELKVEHSSMLESEVKALEKQISNLNVELKAAKDDLQKAKALLDVARSETETLTKQRDEALASAANPIVATEQLEEITRLTKELSHTKDDLNAMTDMLNFTKASLSEMSNNHMKELEEAAKGRAEEVTKLRAGHDMEVATFATQKSELSIRVSDLEGELATLRASISIDHTSTKSNGFTAPHPSSPNSTSVTKEELQRAHEAHNLKLYDLQAEHDKAMKALQEQLKVSEVKAEELQQEVARKAMEIQYLEQDQEENQEQITRLKEDLEATMQRLNDEQTPST